MKANDAVSRRAAEDIVRFECGEWEGLAKTIIKRFKELPSAQSDRDIPKRPNATVDRAWGIPCRQAICPNCDCYLGMIHFISESDKTKITYCESCGQAIDWEGWNSDE